MFGWLRKKPPPLSKRCSQCATEMDPDEIVCPQCGAGIDQQAAERARKAAEHKTPAIDMSDLSGQWPGMRPAERRQAMRARLLGTDRTLRARISRRLGLGGRPRPPAARRVAARALALSAVIGRAYLEMNLKEMPPESWNPQRQHLLTWLGDLGIVGELESQEHALLTTPCERLDPQAVTAAAWRGEGLAVLAWALGRFRLPRYDEQSFPPELAQESVGFGNAEAARNLLATAALRPAEEIERFAVHATIISWRFRTFGIYPGPWDLVDYLRRQASFRETWLEDLPIIQGDLALGDQPLARAPAEQVATSERIALERHIAAYWLEGDDAVYSKVDPATLLSAC
jgi:hypothetical protein